MRKIVFISFIFLLGCSKPEIPYPQIIVNDDIFKAKQSSVTNGQPIHIKLPSAGTYTLSLIDSVSSQIISRERFIGQNGENIKKIYTNSLPKGYLILVLTDINKNQLGRTIIINN